MPVGRQCLASLVALLDALPGDSEALLIYKHTGMSRDDFPAGAMGCLQALSVADPDEVWEVLGDVVRTRAALRAGVSPKYLFDDPWRELERWLVHDGWVVEDDELVAVAPAAEDATGVRDVLILELENDALDEDGGVRTSLANSATAFVSDPPDYNASVTNSRVALETIARRAAQARANAGGVAYVHDSWGNALLYLRNAGVLTAPEEAMLARVYTFGSPGAHVPVGLTQQEWARLARTFLIGACFYVLRSHNAAA